METAFDGCNICASKARKSIKVIFYAFMSIFCCLVNLHVSSTLDYAHFVANFLLLSYTTYLSCFWKVW